MKWAPKVLGALFIDDRDYNGLQFWYNDIKEQSDKLKKEQDATKTKGKRKR